MRLIDLREERTQLEDENSAKTNHIKEQTGLDVLQFDF